MVTHQTRIHVHAGHDDGLNYKMLVISGPTLIVEIYRDGKLAEQHRIDELGHETEISWLRRMLKELDTAVEELLHAAAV